MASYTPQFPVTGECASKQWQNLQTSSEKALNSFIELELNKSDISQEEYFEKRKQYNALLVWRLTVKAIPKPPDFAG